jgi:hypothetical protein
MKSSFATNEEASMVSETLEGWRRAVVRTAARSQDPSQAGATAQLVVGRIQAGKTSSFTGLIRLLADNDYKVFVVIAGSSVNLRDQTLRRLNKDLNAENGFEIIPTGTGFDPDVEARTLSRRLRRWQQGDSANQPSWARRPVVYVALKSTTAHLTALEKMFSQLKNSSYDANLLSVTPTLIVDDECDQASPNAYTSSVSQARDMSAIYGLISSIRGLLARHTYVGYTATPYANILMDVQSSLRPQGVTLLSHTENFAGPSYVGSEDLFGPGASFPLEINDWDFEELVEIPNSLRYSFAYFLCQSAVIHGPRSLKEMFLDEPFLSKVDSQVNTTVSMLVHAHQFVRHSEHTFALLVELQESWGQALNEEVSEGFTNAAADFIWETFFEPALVDLESRAAEKSGPSASKPPGIDRELIRALVNDLVSEIKIMLITGNGDDFPDEDEFQRRPGWVLVGGQLLDRGQTLPNLLCTYMPRSAGGAGSSNDPSGQYDTMQQRARFYGHRKQYESLLKGWFDTQALATYREIASNEPNHFDVIRNMDDAGLELGQYPVLLKLGPSPRLRLVRANVVPRNIHLHTGSKWFSRQLWYSATKLGRQREVLRDLATGCDFVRLSENTGFGNFRAEIDAEHLGSVIQGWNVAARETTQFWMAGELLKNWEARTGGNLANVVLMSRRSIQGDDLLTSHGEFRTSYNSPYSIEGDGWLQIKQLPSSNDDRFVDQNIPTVQFHFIDVKRVTQTGASEIVIPDAIGVTVAFPGTGRFILAAEDNA